MCSVSPNEDYLRGKYKQYYKANTDKFGNPKNHYFLKIIFFKNSTTIRIAGHVQV